MDFNAPFFMLHRDLPREGPGEPSDVAWAIACAGLQSDARICDAACGPAPDINALLQTAPDGTVDALDKVPHFVAAAAARNKGDIRVKVRQGDMAELHGMYDFIWCAGAVYFLGVTEALGFWRRSLAPGGAIAFSQACWFLDAPSERARRAFADYPAMSDEAGVLARIEAGGYEVLGSRRLSDQAWENYYGPMAARIAKLRPTAELALEKVLDEGIEEAATWRACRAEFGYLLCVVRPK